VLRPNGERSVWQARALYRLVVWKTLNRVTTGTEEAELFRATEIAEQFGDSDVLLELMSDRGTARLEAGDIEGGLGDLTSAMTRAGEGGADTAEHRMAAFLTDAYLWLLRLSAGADVGRRGIEHGLAQGYRESYSFSILVGNTVECLLLQGERDMAETLVADHIRPEVTIDGWPLLMARAELDLLAGDTSRALTWVEKVESLRYNNDEMRLWLAEVGAAADLWQGDCESAWERTGQVWAVVEGSPLVERASRMLTFSAAAAANLADSDADADRAKLGDLLRDRAEHAQCFIAHPARVLGSAYGATFDAELARLQRREEESTWRAAKDTWAGHGVPHHAAYAGWRLAECLFEAGKRGEAEAELAESFVAAEGDVPLQREVEGLARRARFPLPAKELDATPTADAIAAGGSRHGLTPRELAVLQLLGSGATNAEIGRRLYMSPKTASVHVSAILRKLGVTGRLQAAMAAQRMGLLNASDDTSREL
jgi:DNA-binding CsgD family transcriptional regulator